MNLLVLSLSLFISVILQKNSGKGNYKWPDSNFKQLTKYIFYRKRGHDGI